jgi:hypothetical protein
MGFTDPEGRFVVLTMSGDQLGIVGVTVPFCRQLDVSTVSPALYPSLRLSYWAVKTLGGVLLAQDVAVED